MILVDADKKIMGRVATFVAKKALEGNQVTVVNAEKAFVTGSKENAMKRIKRKLELRGKGNPEKGPKFSRMPDRVFREAVKGMLPWKSSRGKEAFHRVHVYIGVPEEFSGKEFAEVKGANVKRFEKTAQVGLVCRLLGARW
jgi:large subunit ribosomal protein L13